jgi:uncharacterized membrane protein YkoI
MVVAMPLLAVVVLVLGLAATPGPVWSAQPGGATVVAQAEGVQPLASVLRRIAARVPGRALDAQQTERNGQPIYRVKWLGEDGKVRDVIADARTGQILEMR